MTETGVVPGRFETLELEDDARIGELEEQVKRLRRSNAAYKAHATMARQRADEAETLLRSAVTLLGSDPPAFHLTNRGRERRAGLEFLELLTRYFADDDPDLAPTKPEGDPWKRRLLITGEVEDP